MWSVVYKHLALFINKRVVHKHRVYFCGICCIYAYACLPVQTQVLLLQAQRSNLCHLYNHRGPEGYEVINCISNQKHF